MQKVLFILIGMSFYNYSIAQGGWSWTEKTSLPIATSNNGITAAKVGDTTFVYSFAGITGSRHYSEMHSKAFKYNTISNKWDTIPSLPDSLGGLVALSAHTIKNKIYIIGGFHVYSNNTSLSSYEVHIFNPLTETYTKGKRIPTTIDDHVSCIYKDSLLYIITGWTSDLNKPIGENINLVQIYNPSTDNWETGTPTNKSNTFMAFGASGSLLNDTIYYAGGAQNGSFALKNILRKGIIDKDDPTQIVWSADTSTPGRKLYRAASLAINNSIFWIGGSAIPYDFNGLSYTSNMPVSPRDTILEWDPTKRKFYRSGKTDFSVMDLRGIAQISKNQFIIAGGMLEDTTVSNKTFLLEYDTNYIHSSDTLTAILALSKEKITIYPNPSNGIFSISKNKNDKLIIYNVLGIKKLETYDNTIRILNYKPGKYFVEVHKKNKTIYRGRIIIY